MERCPVAVDHLAVVQVAQLHLETQVHPVEEPVPIDESLVGAPGSHDTAVGAGVERGTGFGSEYVERVRVRRHVVMNAPLLADADPPRFTEIDPDVAEPRAEDRDLVPLEQQDATAGGFARVERARIRREIHRPLGIGEEADVRPRFVLEADPRPGVLDLRLFVRGRKLHAESRIDQVIAQRDRVRGLGARRIGRKAGTGRRRIALRREPAFLVIGIAEQKLGPTAFGDPDAIGVVAPVAPEQAGRVAGRPGERDPGSGVPAAMLPAAIH